MWYILNFVPPRGKNRSILPALARMWELEVFAPTFVALETEAGEVKKRERPLLYHYIFVRGEEKRIKEFARLNDGFSFVIDRGGSSRHLTVSDQTLEQFRLIASYHAGKLPCYPLEGIDLEAGDKVQIVSGQFSGLTGTYMSRKGGKGGNILVAVDSGLAAIVYDIKAEYVRVLEFARDSRRLYDQLDAFAAKLTDPAIGEMALRSAATAFTTRLGVVKAGNPKIEAKLQILLYGAYRALYDTEKSAEALAKFKKLERHVTNEKTRRLCEKLLYRNKK